MLEEAPVAVTAGLAEESNRHFTVSGVKVGLFCSISATTPAVTHVGTRRIGRGHSRAFEETRQAGGYFNAFLLHALFWNRGLLSALSHL
jgi:hypothetical protein